MIRKLAVLAAILPVAALAQGPGPRAGGPGTDERIERMERRARLARNLGLAEVLGLDTAGTTKLADSLAKQDEKRVALHKKLRDARHTLRRAAQGEKVTAAEVDGALATLFDVGTQSLALDRETLAVVTKDLNPERKAQAALFLARFQHRMGGKGMGPGMMGGRGMGGGMGRGMGGGMGGGMGPGMNHGPGGGMGPGMDHGPGGGMGPGTCPNCPWDDDD